MANNNLKRYNNLSYLYSPFREEVIQLILSIRQNQLPFIVYETYRTPQRQKYLNHSGYSTNEDPFLNAHVNGLAIDFMINEKAVKSPSDDSMTIEQIVEKTLDERKPPKSLVLYDIGTNLLPANGKEARTIVENQNVLDFWQNLGKLIKNQFPSLSWNGDKNKKENQLIGIDPPHVEFKKAPSLIRSGIARQEIKRAGAPGLK